jgi:hypothetical protein
MAFISPEATSNRGKTLQFKCGTLNFKHDEEKFIPLSWFSALQQKASYMATGQLLGWG